MVNDAELNEQEVEHSTFSGDTSVDFSEEVDLDFCFFGFGLLSLDLSGSFLGYFQGFNQFFVLQNSSRISIRQVLKKIIFEFSQLNLESILLVHQLLLSLFQVRFLHSHDHSQQLIFQTALSDDEVNDCALSSSLGLVMGIVQFSLQVQLEGRTDLDILRAQFDSEDLAFLDELSGEERIQDCIDFLAQGFYHEH